MLSTLSCFEYSNVEPRTVPAGRELQITVTPEGRQALGGQVGTNVRTIIGRVVSADTSGVRLALERTTLTDGSTAQWSGEQVNIPSPYISDTQERTLSKGKTAAAVAVLAGVSAAVALALGRTGSSGSGTVPGTPGK